MNARVWFFAVFFCWVSTLVSPIARAEEGVKPLFDGKTLEGWTQRGGKAKYSVEDGAIVGTTVPNTPNSFLCTVKDASAWRSR
jgi:hypothetical protein